MKQPKTLEDALRVISAMNGVSLHQTDRVFPPFEFGGVKIPQRVHPLTCGNNSSHTPLYPFYEDGMVKLICRECDYTQNNASLFSCEVPDEN